MNQKTIQENPDKRAPIERLVDIADATFERARKLNDVKLVKKEDETAQQTILEMRDDGFLGVIATWHVILDMLPTSDLNQSNRKALEVDAYKIISRCYHRLDKLNQAASAITNAIDRGYIEGFISLGAIYIDAEEYDKAETAFNTALSKEAMVMRAHAGLAELYFILGSNSLKADDKKHVVYFERAEQEFLSAGKERFHESYERAMDLFEAIGWKDNALSMGEKAVEYYTENRLRYGDRLKHIDARIRKMASDERYERIIARVGRKLGDIVGGKERDADRD